MCGSAARTASTTCSSPTSSLWATDAGCSGPTTKAGGFRTVVPSHYPIPTDGPVAALLGATGRHPYRPAHIHFIVEADGHRPLTTHIFVADGPYLDSDAVFAVKESLVVDFAQVDDEDRAHEYHRSVPAGRLRHHRRTGYGPGRPVNTPLAFSYEALPMRVVMGTGALGRLADEIDHASLKRVMVLCSPGQRELAVTVAGLIGPRAVDIHPPRPYARARRVGGRGPTTCERGERGRLRRRRRRLGDRPRKDRRSVVRPAGHRRTDDVRRLRDDARVGCDGERRQTHRPGSTRPAGLGAVRPRAHRDRAGGGLRGQRHERDRARGRGPLRARRLPPAST
ncbi:hypothetical protein ABH941_007047 [Streptacidiphilus sp. EB103A]